MKDFAELPTQSWTSCDDVATNLKSNEANVENIAVLDVMNATSNSNDAVSKLVKIWENKNAQRALRGAGLSTMAVSLAACGGGSSTSSTTTTPATPATPAGSSFELTTGVDNITGTAGNDTFAGLQSGVDADDQVDSFDSVNGGEGTDTLHIINEAAAAYSGVNATSIEVFKYQATNNAGDLDADDAPAGAEIILFRSENGIDVSDLTTAMTLKIEDSRASADHTITYLAADVDNAADSDTVTLDGAAAGADLTFAGDVETMNIVTAGSASSFADLEFDADGTTALNLTLGQDLTATQLNAAAVTTLTITGAGDFTANATGNNTDNDFDALTTFNASAATGAIQVLFNDATALAVTTGSGDDVVDMTGTLTRADTINLGAGNDTLRVDIEGLAAGLADLTVTNVETLRLDGINVDGAINMDNLSFNTVRFDDAGAANADGGVITLTDIATAITSFVFRGGSVVNDDLFFSPVTIDYDTTTAIAAATVTIDNGATGVVADDILVGAITAANVTALTINASEIGQADADELTITDVVADNMTDLTLVADGAVVFSGIDGNVLDTIDFTAADSGVTAQIDDAAAALQITTGDGNDSIDVADDTVAATINLGAGNDTFISGNAADTITTGAGIDTVRLTGATTDDDNVITDFTAGAGGDILDFATNAANDGGVGLNNIEVFGGGDDALAAGFSIIDNGDADIANADNLTVAGIVDRLNDLGDDNNGNAADDIISMEASDDDNYIAISDGTDTAICLIVDVDGNDTVIEAADVHILVILEGVGDAGTLTAANLADFV